MPQNTLLFLCPSTCGHLSCSAWGVVRKCLQQERQGKALGLPGHLSCPCPCPWARTSLAIHVCVGFAGEDAVLVGDSVQGLGDVQEGVAAVNNPRHFLGAGSEFVIHKLRERLPQLVLVTWKQNQRREVWVWSPCKAALRCFGFRDFIYRAGQREKKKGGVGTITERVPIVVVWAGRNVGGRELSQWSLCEVTQNR